MVSPPAPEAMAQFIISDYSQNYLINTNKRRDDHHHLNHE